MTEQFLEPVANRRIPRRRLVGLAVAGVTLLMDGDNKSTEAPIQVLPPDVPAVQVEPAVGIAAPPLDSSETPLFPDTPVVITPKHRSLTEENLETGHDGWKPTRPDTNNTALFTSPNSILPGESIDFHGASNSGAYTLHLFRLGWYGGKGGRLMYKMEEIKSPTISTKKSSSGAAMASWDTTHTLTIPDEWRSGLYLAIATGRDGGQCMAPFWVRSQETTAPILASSGLLTYAAYNNWFGRSLYGGTSVVSLDRPLKTRGGAGEVLPWDIAVVRYLEKGGFDADYMADVDSHVEDDIYENRKLILMAGHHEYYTEKMRQRLNSAVEGKINIALFGSNAVYWKIRLEDSAFGKNRVVVCYKNGGDPDKVNTTGLFRNLGSPEAELFGVAYEQPSSGDDWVVENPEHWVFENTGLQKGDSIKRVIGPEYDSIIKGVTVRKQREILAASVVNKGPKQGHSYSCLVTHDSGARVFSAGSLDWVYALDDYRMGWTNSYQIPLDERAQTIAGNVVKRLSS